MYIYNTCIYICTYKCIIYMCIYHKRLFDRALHPPDDLLTVSPYTLHPIHIYINIYNYEYILI